MAAAWSVDHRRSGRDMRAGVDDVALVTAFHRSQLNVEKLLTGSGRWNYFRMSACRPTLRRLILRSARCRRAFTRIAADASGADRRQRLSLNSTYNMHHARHRKPFANIDEHNQYVKITGSVNFFYFSCRDSKKFRHYLIFLLFRASISSRCSASNDETGFFSWLKEPDD